MSQLVLRLLEQAGLPTDLKQIIGRMFIATTGNRLISGTVEGLDICGFDDDSGHIILTVSTVATARNRVYVTDIRWNQPGWAVHFSHGDHIQVEFSLQ